MKKTLVISCPIDTYSGYGGRARDFVKALLKIGKYDIKILAQKWGNTRWGYLVDHNEEELASLIIKDLTFKPDIWIQCTIPNEFQPVGHFNIGLTAAMETDRCDASWILGANKMDLLIVSSEHSKFSLTNSKYRTKEGGQIKLETPTEVLFEGLNLDYQVDKKMLDTLNSIPEQTRFFATGHWMKGTYGEDRKNIALTVKTFLDTFKNAKQKPALILKTGTGTTGIADRDRVIENINLIRNSVKGTLPNIYLIHGDISDNAIHTIYAKGKLTGYISLTKGEGFGRTILEATMHNIPVIASGWSGHMDFLDKEKTMLVGGKLKQVDKSAVVPNMILEHAQWFSPDEEDVARKLKYVAKNQKEAQIKAKQQGHINRKDFSFDAMVEKLTRILDRPLESPENIHKLPKLELPTIQKFN